MSTKEILTLQFGHYANFVGTHWWNIQEMGFQYEPSAESSDINHDVLYREGKTSRNEVTYTPRLLLVDLKDSLKTLSMEGTLYDEPTLPGKIVEKFDDIPVDMQVDEKQLKNMFLNDIEQNSRSKDITQKEYDLENNVQVWSDYMYTRYHPRTVNIVKNYRHKDDKIPFDLYPLGVNVWKTEEFQEDFSDKIRNYIEECDFNQGFQILMDATNGFSGLATSCIENLKDEYERKAILSLPLITTHYNSHNMEQTQYNLSNNIKIINLALTFDALVENCSLFVPLCLGKNGWKESGTPINFNHVNYNYELNYHSSAILASALDTFTLKYRLKSTTFNLSDLCTDFNTYGRKVAAASLCFPFSLNMDSDLIECLDNWEGPLWKSISPRCTIGTHHMLQSITLRGVPENRLKKPPSIAGNQKDLRAYNCYSVKEMLNFYLTCASTASATDVTTCASPLSVKCPFPNLFDDKVGTEGDIVHENKERVQNVRVLSGLHTGNSVGEMIQSLNEELEKIKFHRFHQFKVAGIEQDEFTECIEKLKTLRECYED